MPIMHWSLLIASLYESRSQFDSWFCGNSVAVNVSEWKYGNTIITIESFLF